jgi:hypothetical protein
VPAPLILPSGLAPSNLHLREGHTARFVDGDLYNICERVKEVDRNLHVVELDKGDDGHCFAIMEHCNDGIERLIFTVRELDSRVIERLQRIMHMDLRERLAVLEAEEYKYEADRKENELEALYENMGDSFRRQLYRDGFSQSPVSHPKRGVTGGRGSAKRGF